MNKDQFDDLLTKYVESMTQQPEVTTYIGEIVRISDNPGPKEQFFALGTISNYHWKGNPSERDPKKITTPKIPYVTHMLNTPSLKYQPASPRNRLMMYLKQENEEKLSEYLQYMKCIDTQQPTENEEISEPQPKRRKLTARSKKVQKEKVIKRYISPGVQAILDDCVSERSVYSTFKNQLLTSGLIKWRLSEGGKDICVMNDINSTSGHLIPNSFVHVSCEEFEEGPIIKCNCEIYKFLRNSLQEEDIDNPELDPSTSCMHCRFFHDHLMDAYAKIISSNSNLPRPLDMVKNSLGTMCSPVILLGEPVKTGATKFSVNGNDTLAIVTLTFVSGACYIKCHNGMCGASNINKKRMPKSAVLGQTLKMCCHLQTCSQNIAAITQYFPEYFNTGDTDEEDENGNILDEPNIEDDETVDNYLQSTFDKTTGLWQYKSLSKHRPKDLLDEKLTKGTRLRMKLVIDSPTPDPTIDFKPNWKKVDGSPRDCDCGGTYTEEGIYQEGLATLYTRVGCVHLKYYSMKCSKNSCEKKYTELAKEEGIFFYTKMTCAGDEIGWDFIRCVKSSKISFTGFCTQMTNFYRTTHSNPQPFMAVKTFIGWFFGWLSAFKIDFRKEIDPFCGYNPRVLACDGTHIGVSLRHLKLDKPVTKPDKTDVSPWVHGKPERRMFHRKQDKDHVKYMCRKILNQIKPEQILSDIDERGLTLETLQKISQDKPLRDFIEPILYQTGRKDYLDMCAEFVHSLSGDEFIGTVVSPRCIPLLRTIFDKIARNENCAQELGMMRKYNCQIADLFWIASDAGKVEEVVTFLKYLIDRVEAVHYKDPNPTEVKEIANSYDPRTGTAYYFTERGNQLREMPTYQTDIENQRRNKNRREGADSVDEEQCRKKYPLVSFGGYSYILLWFCPLHGHSYGFHLIDGAEGRKDPFCSLVKYMEQMPEELYYDFACSLSEYCLNREPDLFKNTRFWHDLFHAIGHICGINFKSTKVEGLDGVNSEICEQVNSYLQCIKYTGAHLSQEHFVFFLQFFLYLLNKEKTERQREMAKIALAGHQ